MRRLVLALLLGLAACGGDDADPVAGGPAGLEVAVVRERLFETQRSFEATFVNAGDAPVEISSAVLSTELYEALPPDDRTLTVQPTGDPISVPVPYGAAVCDGEPDPAMALEVDLDGSPTTLPVGDAGAGILRVHAAECAAAEVADAVTIDFGPEWTPAGPGRRSGTITVRQRGDAEAQLVGVNASVVFAVDVTSDLPATDDVEVTITAARCDAHALTESKKTFTFPLLVVVDRGDPVRLELEAKDGPVRQALDEAIVECVAARTGHAGERHPGR